MSGFIDSSVIIRYLVGDSPQMVARAIEIIDGASELIVTDVALIESAFVMTRVYRLSRASVVDGLIGFVLRANVTVYGLSKDDVVAGLTLCRASGRVSFADAMIWAAARSSGVASVYSFDQRFPSESINVLRDFQ